jgi:acyl-CoA thioesterase-1
MKKNRFFIFVLLIYSQILGAQTILFLGDSLTEGYQLAKEEAYPHLIEQNLKKKIPTLKVINGGVSGSTSASGTKRLDWYLKSSPSHLVLALGANDGLRGFKIEDSKKNLSQIIEKAQKSGMKVILVGMEMPRNYGEDYRKKFQQMFVELSKTYKVKFVPFLLEGVGGRAELNLPDGIHPNPNGHKVMAKNILKVLEAEL